MSTHGIDGEREKRRDVRLDERDKGLLTNFLLTKKKKKRKLHPSTSVSTSHPFYLLAHPAYLQHLACAVTNPSKGLLRAMHLIPGIIH